MRGLSVAVGRRTHPASFQQSTTEWTRVNRAVTTRARRRGTRPVLPPAPMPPARSPPFFRVVARRVSKQKATRLGDRQGTLHKNAANAALSADQAAARGAASFLEQRCPSRCGRGVTSVAGASGALSRVLRPCPLSCDIASPPDDVVGEGQRNRTSLNGDSSQKCSR